MVNTDPTLQSTTDLPQRRGLLRRLFLQPVDDVIAGLEQLAVGTRRPGLLMASLVVIGGLSWFIYVPIHELLHVAGCVVTGGDIHTLELQPRYGGKLLARVFPWVVTESDYAGRLSGFDTKGSDWIYLATDFTPFLLTVFPGVLLVKLCGRRRHPVLFPIAIVLGFAPFYNLTGDYVEMGSIIITRAATWIVGPKVAAPPPESLDGPDAVIVGGETDAAYAGLRADDIFRLGTDLITRPGYLGLRSAGQFAMGLIIFVLSAALATLLAFLTYFVGHLVTKPLLPQRPTAPRIAVTSDIR